jgi:ABC-type Fe3+-hydroxamate transport system substrate-binding protein
VRTCILAGLDQTGESQISLTDPDSRAMASVTVFAVAPEKMLGWTRAPGPEARPFLPARYAELPEIGRLTGRGNTVNLENIVRLAPDLVLDVGSTTATYVSLADQVQEQTQIPAVLIGGRLADAAATLRTVGGLLGVPDRAEALARHAESVLGGVQEAFAKLMSAQRPSVYVACGPRGLETAVARLRDRAVTFTSARSDHAQSGCRRGNGSRCAARGHRLAVPVPDRGST